MTTLIKIKSHLKLTQTQTAFNKLVGLVDKRQKELSKATEKIERGRNRVAEKLLPFDQELALLKTNYALILNHWLNEPKLSPQEIDKIETLISKAVDDARPLLPHNADLVNLHRTFKHKSEGNDTRDDHQAHESSHAKRSKSTAKSVAPTAEAPELKKMAKQLYTDLAKKIHPDLERDEQMRLEKTELMKQVIDAYNNHDIFGLLHLHQTYMDEEQQMVFDELGDDRTKNYVSMLKKQAAALQQQIDDIKNGARTQFIFHLMSGTELEQEQKLAYVSSRFVARNVMWQQRIDQASMDLKTFRKHLKARDWPEDQ